MAKGSKRQRQPGVWELRVYLGRDPMTGRPLQRSRTFRGGSRAANDALVKLLDDARREPIASHGTVATLIDRYLAFLETRGASPKTLASYRSNASAVVERIGNVPLHEVTASTIDGLYDWLLGDRSPGTVRQFHILLSGAFKQALKWGLVAFSPVALATPPAYPRREPTAPSVEQVRRLLVEAEQRNPMLAALLFTAAVTGARRGELCGLRASDIDLAAGTITVRRAVVRVTGRTLVKSTKTGHVRRLALGGLTAAVLASRLAKIEQDTAGVRSADDPYVFSHDIRAERPMNPDVVTTFFGRLRDDVGLRTVTLHHLRRFMVTQGLAGGWDVRTVAGRAGHDPTMALRSYAAVLEVKDRGLAEAIGALLVPSG